MSGLAAIETDPAGFGFTGADESTGGPGGNATIGRSASGRQRSSVRTSDTRDTCSVVRSRCGPRTKQSAH
jgi:hypothetical protein